MAKKKQMLPDLTKQDILTPLDISQLGSNGDPCFGIGYDLSTKECKLCGDSELCAFKMSQNLNITRKELEQKNQYKDLDVLEDTVGIKKFIRSLIRKGKDRKRLCGCRRIKLVKMRHINFLRNFNMLCLVGAPSNSSKGALPVEFLKSEYISH